MNCTYEYIDNWLKANLSKERYEHSLGTAECARELAKEFGVDEETSNEVKLKQAVKAPLPIVFTVEGILIFSNNLTILKQ